MKLKNELDVVFNLTTINAVTDILKGGFFQEFLCLMECHDDDVDGDNNRREDRRIQLGTITVIYSRNCFSHLNLQTSFEIL